MLTLSEKQNFHLIFAQGSKRISLMWAKVRGNESSSYRAVYAKW